MVKYNIALFPQLMWLFYNNLEKCSKFIIADIFKDVIDADRPYYYNS
jgi:hypothetical protein